MAVAVSLFGAASGALAQDDQLRVLLSGLDAPSLEEREAAQRELGDLEGVTSEDIEHVLRVGTVEGTPDGTPLSREQYARLESVARLRFMQEPRAAMGIQFSIEAEQGVSIANVIEGFDSVRVLRPGDVILTVDGKRLENREHLRALILSRKPGETMRLAVSRDGRPVEVVLTLGQFGELPQARLDSQALGLAWMLRASTFGFSGRAAGVIDTGLSAEGWRRASLRVDTALSAIQLSEQRQWGSRGGPPSLVVGGEPRPVSKASSVLSSSGAGWMRRDEAEARLRALDAQPDFRELEQRVLRDVLRAAQEADRDGRELNRDEQDLRTQIAKQLIEIRQIIGELEGRAEGYRERLRAPNLSREMRTRLVTALREEEQGIATLKKRAELIQKAFLDDPPP